MNDWLTDKEKAVAETSERQFQRMYYLAHQRCHDYEMIEAGLLTFIAMSPLVTWALICGI